MTGKKADKLREQYLTVLKDLSEEERQLFSRVIRIERENLHIEHPRKIAEDLLKAVREVLK